MPHTQSSRRRVSLLLGGALAALSASIALPAGAQSVPQANVQASGISVLATDQQQADTAVMAKTSGPLIDLGGAAAGTDITVTSNTVSATAQANRATASLSPSLISAPVGASSTSLQAGYAGTISRAPTLIATRQSSDDVAVSSTLAGDVTPARVGAVLGAVSGTSANVANNTTEAVALANSTSGTLAQSGVTGGGAGLVSDQLATGNSVISADQTGVMRLKADSLTGSTFSLGGNLERAIGYGNSAANQLSSDTAALDLTGSSAIPSKVGAYTNSPAVGAGLAILADQRLAGTVEATNTGGFNMRIYGPASGSRLDNSTNALVAAGYGNQSANSLTLATPTISGGGAVANVTNVQQVADLPISATSLWGARILVDGSADATDATMANNTQTALAYGNKADGNTLAVSASSVSAGGSGPIPIVNAVGTASATDVGAMSVTAPFSVQNDQSDQGSITAATQSSMLWMNVGGALTNASLTASGNAATVGATGNSAANGLTLTSANLATASDLNSFQAGEGTIKALAGSVSDPGGVTMQVGGSAGVTGSSLAITGNSLSANATENNVSNTLAVTGSTLANGSGHTNAVAGTTTAGIGAAADYALANSQQIKGGYQLPVGITSEVDGVFAVNANAGVSGSTVSVTGNSQAATALGNGAVNSLAITAASLGGNGVLAPGSALSSDQSGQTDVSATSNMALGATFSSANSSATIADNSNLATASMNSATNALNVAASTIAGLSGSGATMTGDAGLIGTAVGDHVLANNQFADGSITALAVTTPAFNGGTGFIGSSAAVSGNVTKAQAVANTAANTLSLTAASAPASSAGLGNFQQNDAGVSAQATTGFAGFGGLVQGADASFVGNQTASQAQGNAASNAMTVTGAASSDCAPNLALVTTGPLNSASGPAVLSNVQTNAGAILASSTGPVSATSGLGASIVGSTLGLNGNTISAAAYGNSATNQITLTSATTPPAAVIANTQVNSAPVTAQVTSVNFLVGPAATSGSRIAISGNAMTAQAIGNYAASTIATAH